MKFKKTRLLGSEMVMCKCESCEDTSIVIRYLKAGKDSEDRVVAGLWQSQAYDHCPWCGHKQKTKEEEIDRPN